jgi:hypothetical protein
MKSNDLLGRFITFVLLLSLPRNEVVISDNLIYIQPTTADFLPLTRFLMAFLDRVRAREFAHAVAIRQTEVVFRFATLASNSVNGRQY